MIQPLVLGYLLIFWAHIGLGQSDPAAEQVLTRSKNAVNALNDLHATFKKTLVYQGSARQPVAMSGQLEIKKNKFRIELSDRIVFCDGKTTWDYLKQEKEVTISNYDPKEGFSPDKIFKISQEDMRSRLDGVENFGGRAHSKVTLIPNSSKTDYHRLEVWIDNNTNFPSKILIKNRNGSDVTFEVTNLKTNSGLTDTRFVFDTKTYPGTEVIDNR